MNCQAQTISAPTEKGKTMETEEVMPYKKKSQAKSPRKSKHKHKYELCLVEYPQQWYLKEHARNDEKTTDISAYCPMCGKRGPVKNLEQWILSERPMGCGFIRQVVTEEYMKELNPETRTLPTFWIDEPFQKRVEVDNET